MPYRTSRERFERLAEEAVANLPSKFKRRFKNLSFVVEDYPSHEDAERLSIPKEELLGMFDGVSYTDMDMFFDMPHPLPNRIVLYRKNIEAVCSTEEELKEEIGKTVMHEVGHYFGMSEEDLEEYEE